MVAAGGLVSWVSLVLSIASGLKGTNPAFLKPCLAFSGVADLTHVL